MKCHIHIDTYMKLLKTYNFRKHGFGQQYSPSPCSGYASPSEG